MVVDVGGNVQGDADGETVYMDAGAGSESPCGVDQVVDARDGRDIGDSRGEFSLKMMDRTLLPEILEKVVALVTSFHV